MDASLLKESWELVDKTRNEFTHVFYTCLFRRYPATRSLFKSDMAQQERALASMLQVAARGADRLTDLLPALQQLGIRHVGYGVLAEHYPAVGEVLIDTFSVYLGRQFTPAMRESWIQAYQAISTEMIKAAATVSAQQ